MMLKLCFRIFVYIFYREVDIIGTENIPEDEAVIFCGNHQNQFVDALMLYSTSPRPVSFIIAAKSMKRLVVGAFARLLDAIPVRRPQDEAKVGTGDIVEATHSLAAGQDGRVIGQGTLFTKEVVASDLITVKDPDRKEAYAMKVTAVVSDTELHVKAKEDFNFHGEGVFKVLPKIDHDVMFKNVFDTLDANGVIGIFPEGGSHDRTALLPMKDGVARFALGAKAKGIHTVHIVPVGLTYYYGHRFRSRAHVEFGKPMKVSTDLAELFEKDQHKATAQLMEQIEQSMRSVTINAPDWQTLKYIHHMRRLYQPGRIKLPVSEILDLTRKFAIGFEAAQKKGDPAFLELLQKLDLYQRLLKDYLLTDAQVESLDTLEEQTTYSLLFKRMATTAKWFFLGLPGCPVALPVGVIGRLYSSVKADQDLRASSVKIVGNDVKASHKIVSAIVAAPILCVVYGFAVGSVFGFWPGLLMTLASPWLAYLSVLATFNGITEGRAAFPLILSLHSDKYFKCFHQLHCFRAALSQHVLLVVETNFRTLDFWNDDFERTYQLILQDHATPHFPDTQSEPFTVKHSSRLRKKEARGFGFEQMRKTLSTENLHF